MKKHASAAALFFIFVFPGLLQAVDEKPRAAAADIQAGTGSQEFIELRVPLFSPHFSGIPLALVNDEPITLEELKENLGSVHESVSGEKASSAMDYSGALSRLINIKLIIQEAKVIGLNELPEVTMMVDAYKKTTLVELLQKEHVEDMKPDEAEVGKLYKEAVRERKITSVLFEKKEEAVKMQEGLKAGKSYDVLVDEALTSGAAKGEREALFLKNKDLLPQVAQAVSGMKEGQISPVLAVGSGFVIFRLEGERFPEDPEARETARLMSLQRKRIEAITEYNKELSKKYVKLNKKLVDSLDFEAKKPGFDKLLADKRVVAEIKGDKPVTVGDLTQALKEKFFHDVDNAIRSKKVNKRKIGVLEEILGKRIFRLEAVQKGIDKSERYLEMVKEYENSLVFGAFVKKAVIPEIRLGEEDIKAYYEAHGSEYTYPEMVKLEAIAFKAAKNAEATLEKLKQGDDFGWVKENAEGQADKDEKGLLHFGGEILVVTELPEDLQKTIAGVKSGDYRLYAGAENIYYVLAVRDQIPLRKQTYEEVRDVIAKTVFGKKVNEAVEDWARKLRESSDVKVFMTHLDKP